MPRLAPLPPFAALLLFCTAVGLFLTLLNRGNPWGDVGLNLGMSYLIGLGSWGLDCLLTRIGWPSTRLRIPLALLCGGGGGGLLGFLLWVRPLLDDPGQLSEAGLRIMVLVLFFSGLGFILLYTLMALAEARTQRAEDQARIERQQRELAEGRLLALQAQIEPHFLFNTLATIHGLIEARPSTAQAMLESLTDLLRSHLDRSRDASTTLGQELALVRHYLTILQLRMGERLRYTIDLPEGLKGRPLPPLLLQPLVENAIQHGLEPAPAGGELRIRAEANSGCLRIEVCDSGLGLREATEVKPGHGLGLSNVRERLVSAYGNDASLSLCERPEGGVCARLELPDV